MSSNPSSPRMDVLCFTSIRWHWMPQAFRDDLLRTARARLVVLVEEPMFVPDGSSMDVEWPVENLVVARPCLPYALTDGGVARMQRVMLDTWLAERAMRPDILWYHSPAAIAYSAHLRARLTVYDCLDREASAASLARDFARLEHALLERADVVFTDTDTARHALLLLHPNVQRVRPPRRRSLVNDTTTAVSRDQYRIPEFARRM